MNILKSSYCLPFTSFIRLPGTMTLSSNPSRSSKSAQPAILILFPFLSASVANQKRGRSYPATLIGRLGVNVEFQGSRVGGQVIDFLKKWFRDDGNKTGCRFMVVDAYNNERTLRFYESNEFHYLHATEDEERKYYNQDSEKAIHTRLMYMDLINK